MAELTFEDKLTKLDQIIVDLESDTPLDLSMKKYEEGMTLAKQCQKELKQVEGQILKLVENSDAVKAEPIEEHEFPTLF
jgi:exodeoxyribonuclease VII small subunit